ncbi:short-chain dehydrogenase [Roseovarius sp. HI0049]|nr:short-chain dehydrogenase [Roseovarius sp. HI0049]
MAQPAVALGHALAERYRRLGHEVTGTARSGTAELELDVTKPDQFDALAAHVDGKPVDLLICNAGIYPDKGQSLASGFAPETWAASMATNVTGVFLTVQTLMTGLQLAKHPKIAIISSRLGSDELAAGGSYCYRASKAAALNLGRNLAVDLKELEIAVGIYHPGWVRTDMGGEKGEVSVGDSADGLIAEFDRLSLETTGCFRTWDGRDLPF